MKKAFIFILCFLLLSSCGMHDVVTENTDASNISLPVNKSILESAAEQENDKNEKSEFTDVITPPLQEENHSCPVSSTVPEDNISQSTTSAALNENTSEPTCQTVIITVLGLDGVLVYSANSEYRDGLNVFDLLMETAKEKNIPAVYTGGKSSPYITSIGEFAEKGHGPFSGWVYTVNGESIMKPCNKCSLNPDDYVEWKYITEFKMQ